MRADVQNPAVTLQVSKSHPEYASHQYGAQANVSQGSTLRVPGKHVPVSQSYRGQQNQGPSELNDWTGSRDHHETAMAKKFQALLASHKGAAGKGAHSVLPQVRHCPSVGCMKSGLQANELRADRADAEAMGRRDGMTLSALRGCKKGVNQIGDAIDFISDLIKKGGKGYQTPAMTGGVGGGGGTGTTSADGAGGQTAGGQAFGATV